MTLLRRVPAPLAALLVAAGLLSLGWNIAVAPFAGFDEPDHVAYVARLAEHGTPPKVLEGEKTYSTAQSEALAPVGFGRIIANGDAKPPWSAPAFSGFRDFERGLPAADKGSSVGPNPLAKNPPLYYAYAAVAWRLTPGGGLFARLFVMRLFSGLLLLVAVAAAWLLAAELFRTQILPRVVTAGTVALHPFAGFLSGIVNTDVALLAAWTTFLWLAMRLLRLGPAPGRVAGLGLATAATVLVHGRGLAIVPLLLVVLVVVAIRHRPGRRVAAIGAASAAASLVVALVIVRITSAAASGGGLYGGNATLGSGGLSLRQFVSFVWQFYLPRLRFMDLRIGPSYGFGQVFVETWWGSFGAYEVQYPKWVYDLVSIGLVGGALACVGVGIRRFELLVRERWAEVVILLASFLGVVVFLHLASYRALVGGSADPLITGRYLMPLTPVVGVAAAALVVSARRSGPYLASAFLAALTALSITGIALTAVRFGV